MKRVALYLVTVFLLLIAAIANAQPYGNEWIDHSKTYYKFKVGAEGIYRINTAALNAAGIPGGTNGSQFQMFHEGVEAPLLVTTNGAFGVNDYIEFFGENASGKPDTALFDNDAWQANINRSLFSDTGVYFLTINPASTNLRYVNVPNAISNPPAPLSFCYTTSEVHYRNDFFPGKQYSNGFPIYYSEFNNGEGFVDGGRFTNQPFSLSLSTPNIAGVQNAQIKFSVLRNTYNTNNENIKVYLNNQQIADSMLAQDATKHFDLSVPISFLQANNTVQFAGSMTGGSPADYYGCSYITIKYPRDFNVSGMSYFKFELAPSSTFQYLEMQNFNHNNTAPRLYDFTNNKWYIGDIAVANTTRFYIEPSNRERKMLLVAANSSQAFNIQSFRSVQFTNYSSASNQGDYVIVTQQNFNRVVSGRNYVDDYKSYRSSMAGGNRNVIIANVDDLYDQFAYGVETHALAIRRFMKYSYNNFAQQPRDLYLIGKGASYNYNKTYLPNQSGYGFAGNVPSYGYPGSDVDYVNFLPNKLQALNVGRLSAWTPQEVGLYLEKVRSYESALNTPAFPDYDSELWKKKVLHAAGGKKVDESKGFMAMLESHVPIIADTNYGAIISRVSKTSSDPIDQNANTTIDSLINSGVSIITYHGHASSSTFELNTLNTPDKYVNASKFSHFLGLGCDVAHIFTLSALKTISERYLYSTQGASVSMIASDNLQYASFHTEYLPKFYGSLSKVNYGKNIGDHARHAYNTIRGVSTDEFTFFHLESMLLQGDPALRTFSPQKPDYHVSANRMFTIPINVTTDIDSFTLRVVAFNLAKAITDDVELKIEHINPASKVTVIKTIKIQNLYNSDTLSINIPIDKIADLGLNKYRVTIDNLNEFEETSEANNTATYDLFIYSDNLIPVYPQEFSIVTQQGITLKASTLNPFRTMGRYKIELDTTELFNSSLKQQTTITSPGGVIKWTPTVSYTDSTVYYWRTAFDSVINGDYRWTTSSFIYLANGTSGWNQSHYYQYKKDGFDKLNYGADRVFRFPTGNTEVAVYNAVYSQLGTTTPWSSSAYSKVVVNGTDAQILGCQPWGGTIQVMVFDSSTTALWENNGRSGGASGSYVSCFAGRNELAFEFPVNTITGRNNAKHFLDSIPNNQYVLIKNVINDLAYDTALIDEWKADENVNGTGQSLYHTIYNMGFHLIDSFNTVRPFIFFRKKGNNNFPVSQSIAPYADTLIRTFSLPALIKAGKLTSTLIGPAKEWQTLKWKFSAIDGQLQNDMPSVNITGIDTNNIRQLLYSGFAKDTSLSFINAAQYPNLQLQWNSLDSVNRTSPQLDYWRVLYSPVPEAALNPAAHFVFTDSLQTGQTMQFAVAIENLTPLPMDSMLVRYKIIDANNTTHILQTVRYKPLGGNDTLHASINFDPSIYPGRNVFFVEANPDNDQLEQYHPNNLGYLPFKIETDKKNPLIDVTFDGVHILNKDIVSAKPFIKIALRDENQFLKLDDTSLLRLSIHYPSDGINEARNIPFDGTISKFVPAQGNKNEAYIEYKPNFLEDGIYELIVNGKDKSGNVAGHTEYRISFEVVNKATITNVLNYPNPFSTSTAFVFTLTGSQVPTQFKIQILTVTGKVVREVTRQELGNIHVGKNITDYKWDGKDQYGQTLGNGVYFYRVITSLNGSDIEHNSKSGVDKFFKNGYGKMYIMR